MKKKKLRKILDAINPLQRKLRRKHGGTPAEFAAAVYQSVPTYFSMDEARAAVDKYQAEWDAAAVLDKAVPVNPKP